MNSVFIVQHSYESEGNQETKFIGAYSSEGDAELAIKRLKDKPGFRNYPEAFCVDEYELNKDHWTEGFSTMTTIQVKNILDEWTVVQAECLPNKTYKIIEYYENDKLGPFKHLDIVECEERDNELFAVRLNNEYKNTKRL